MFRLDPSFSELQKRLPELRTTIDEHLKRSEKEFINIVYSEQKLLAPNIDIINLKIIK